MSEMLEALDAAPKQVLADDAQAAALLKQGEASEELEQYELAVSTCHAVRRRWPQSAAAKTATAPIVRLRDNEPFRSWRSASGGYTIVAKFVGEEQRRVVLETTETKAVLIDFAKLSRADQLYVVMRRTRI